MFSTRSPTIGAPAAPNDLLSRAVSKFVEIFGIDLRTLALFRVCLALIILIDLALRARDLTAHYSDNGVLPRAALLGDIGQGFNSLHLISGSAKVQAMLFLLAALVALALMVGYRTRLATILSWLLLLSLQARNPALMQGGDMLLYLLLFWGIFLPLDARFSVDASLNEDAQKAPNAFFSMATMALLVQAMSVYTFGALLKTSPVWIPDGTAIYYALHIDYIITPFGRWLGQFGTLLQFLTYYVWTLELIAPLIMFSPVAHYRTRLIGITLLVTLHIGFFLCIYIGIFGLCSITSILAFTPGRLWDTIGQRLRTPERRGVTIYYDEPCAFCRKVCLILRTFLLLPETPILPAQNFAEIHREMQTHNSWVVVDHDGSHHVRFDAIVLVFRRSVLFSWVGRILALAPMRAIGERVYAWVARNRGELGRWSAVTLPYRNRPITPSATAQTVVGLLMLAVLVINLQSIHVIIPRLVEIADSVGESVRLSQGWTMFAPQPSRLDGWFVARGVTRDGRAMDVFRDRAGEPDWNRPESLEREHPTYRWERYRMFLVEPSHARYRPYYARYLCRVWNNNPSHTEKISTVQIYFNAELVPPNYISRRSDRELVVEETCLDKH
jgi:predicted DCC family thiol-disulfide oxidoreductase YuxK